MQRTIAIAVAVAMLAVASPAILTQASESEDPLPAHMDRVVFQAGGLDHPGSEGRVYCTDEDSGPVTSYGADGERDNTYCTTGSHDPAVYSITHGPDLPTMQASGFTGVVESIIQYNGGERRWACTFSSGNWLTCSGTGSWPGQATEFCHDVWAYDSLGDSTTPLLTGFTPGCLNGAIGGPLGIGSNTQPRGDGQPDAAWAAYVIHG